MSIARRLAPATLALAASLSASAQSAREFRSPADHGAHFESPKRDLAPLVEKVRRATARFRDIGVATAEGWVPATPCVSGPNEGAMGVHYVQPTRIGDGVLNAEEPEALIYEPLPGGKWRLVGVEFIELAEVWNGAHDGPAVLDGHLLNLVGAPNRYALPAFYELHVWGWAGNPSGSFADWNTLVSCAAQAAD
jgi:hypothetical protein